ncbi:MAG: hypothetical protein ACI310_05405 [Bacilli bacterium]
MDKYFKPTGNLEGNGTNDMNNGFYIPGDLGDKPIGDIKPAGDLENNNSFKFSENKTVTDDEIKSYIASVQSGVRTYGSVSGGGVMFVSFDRLKDMVNNGYNIIRANYFENMKMIEVEFDVPANYKSR